MHSHKAASTLLDCYKLLSLTRPCSIEMALEAFNRKMTGAAESQANELQAAFSRIKIDIITSGTPKAGQYTSANERFDKRRGNVPPSTRPKLASTIPNRYKTLGLSLSATLEEATAAYREKARLYHPDLYEHLAPEMKEIASVRMQEFNAAFSLVKLDIKKR